MCSLYRIAIVTVKSVILIRNLIWDSSTTFILSQQPSQKAGLNLQIQSGWRESEISKHKIQGGVKLTSTQQYTCKNKTQPMTKSDEVLLRSLRGRILCPKSPSNLKKIKQGHVCLREGRNVSWKNFGKWEKPDLKKKCYELPIYHRIWSRLIWSSISMGSVWAQNTELESNAVVPYYHIKRLNDSKRDSQFMKWRLKPN